MEGAVSMLGAPLHDPHSVTSPTHSNPTFRPHPERWSPQTSRVPAALVDDVDILRK